MKSIYFETKNRFDFFMRSRLSLSRKKYSESGVNLDSILCRLSVSEAQVVKELVKSYRLEPYLSQLSDQSFFDNVMHLVLLDRVFSHLAGANPKYILDIGSKNFSYVVSVYEFARRLHQNCNDAHSPFRIDGIELDAQRMYSNFYSRRACAEYYASLVPNAHYLQGDFLNLSFANRFDLVLHFFPFFDLASLLDWGLPGEYFRPFEIALKSYQCLADGGRLIMANTTEDEYHKGRALLEAAKFECLTEEKVSYSFTAKELFVSAYRKQTKTD